MTTKGDDLKKRVTSREYRESWDRIFNKPELEVEPKKKVCKFCDFKHSYKDCECKNERE